MEHESRVVFIKFFMTSINFLTKISHKFWNFCTEPEKMGHLKKLHRFLDIHKKRHVITCRN